ncbi:MULTISPECIES: DUF6969 family protein [Acidiphilium]|uniref:DUF6969 domain-containing protein n=1 Tax=Acidiphilium rubrum TaxID=526 RepID=A0A8G2CMW2_ACIRU|nr:MULTISPECIES: hypothetical protein [Acidiphilium]SIR32101.1 hypothetical protein SAMN05421828_12442 [Acidiphilium rubrum]
MPAADPARLAAAAALVAALRSIEDRGSNLVAALLAGATFIAFEHHPPGDVHDPVSGAQYYFHAHAPDTARAVSPTWAEIGHIHTFIRPAGRGEGAPIHHLIAIALDRCGRPTALFTTNRWVTDDDFIPAPQAIGYARAYQVSDGGPVSQCINALFALFAADIADLLTARDAAIAAWQRNNPGVDAFEDRDLEITSAHPIDLVAVLTALQDTLA